MAVDLNEIPPHSVNPIAGDYCRDIEAYLCRKNDGHLIRIVGPAFERVCEWAERGVPLKVAYRGIDRYFERYYAKGPRRRPVRVEFCEGDVLEVFDEWRRAVGVVAVREARGPAASPEGRRVSEADFVEGMTTTDEHDLARHRSSLSAHLDRAIARLRGLLEVQNASLGGPLGAVVHELESLRSSSKRVRGEARNVVLERLRALDAALLEAARAQMDGVALVEIRAEADSELAPFKSRMTDEAYERSKAACVDRIIRERGRFPTLSFD